MDKIRIIDSKYPLSIFLSLSRFLSQSFIDNENNCKNNLVISTKNVIFDSYLIIFKYFNIIKIGFNRLEIYMTKKQFDSSFIPLNRA